MAKKVLIIEDEAPLAEALQTALEKANFEVVIALDGEKGLQIAFEIKPDLVLLDILLPKVSGIQVLQKLREDIEWGQKTKILMLTNVDDEVYLNQARKYGSDAYLIKSLHSLEEVVAKVTKELEN